MDNESERVETQVEQKIPATSETEQQPSTSTEEKPTSKVYSEDEFRKLQSKVDKMLFEAQKRAEDAEKLRQSAEEERTSLAKERDSLRAEIERIEDERLEGDTQGLAVARERRRLTKLKQELEQKERKITQDREAQERIAKALAISEISGKYNIKPELLSFARTYEEAETLAKAIQAERQAVKSAEEKPQYDKGVSDAGSGRAFSQQQIASMSQEDYEANKAAINKAWKAKKIK